MTKERLDAILGRLDALREGTDDPDQRRQIREIQQLVVGLRPDEEPAGEQGDERGSDAPATGSDEGDPAWAVDGEAKATDGEADTADED